MKYLIDFLVNPPDENGGDAYGYPPTKPTKPHSEGESEGRNFGYPPGLDTDETDETRIGSVRETPPNPTKPSIEGVYDDDAYREAFEERAAVREFDGRFTRAEAERLAHEDLRLRGATFDHAAAHERANR